MRHRRWWADPALVGFAAAMFAQPALGQAATSEADAPPSERASPDDFLELPLADLLELEVGVVAATRSVSTLPEEAPAIVYVIDRAEIENHGYASLGEALSTVPGLFVVDDLVTANVGIRGIHGGPDSWSRTLKVMIDGHPAHDYATGGALLGPEFMPMAAIERVEVIAGPGSALYGANAFLGVINVITRNPAEGVHGEIETHTKSIRGRHWGGGLAAQVSGRWLEKYPLSMVVSLAAAQYDRSGLMVPTSSPRAAEFARQASQGDRTQPLSGLARLVWEAGPAGRFSIASSYQRLDAHAQFAGESVLSPDNRYVKSNLLGRFDYHIALVGEQAPSQEALKASWLGLIRQGSADQHRLELHLWTGLTRGGNGPRGRLDTGMPTALVLRRRDGRALQVGTELTYQLGRSSVLLGSDFIGGHFSGEELVDIDRVSGRETSRNHPAPLVFRNVGVFAQMILYPLDWLGITGGLRWDHASRPGGGLSARAALNLRIRRVLYLKYLFGTSYVPPSPTQLSAVPLTLVGGIAGNPDLRPQTAGTHEISLAVHAGRALRVELSGFHTQIEDRIEFSRRSPLQFAENQTGSTSIGSSLRAEYERDFLWANLQLSWQRTEVDDPKIPDFHWELAYGDDVAGGRAPPNYPALIARLRAGIRLPERHFSLGLSANFVGARKSTIANIMALGRSYQLDPYVTLDVHLRTLGLALFPGRETTLSLHGTNVTNTRYEHGGALGVDIPAEGVAWTLRLRQQF